MDMILILEDDYIADRKKYLSDDMKHCIKSWVYMRRV